MPHRDFQRLTAQPVKDGDFQSHRAFWSSGVLRAQAGESGNASHGSLLTMTLGDIDEEAAGSNRCSPRERDS